LVLPPGPTMGLDVNRALDRATGMSDYDYLNARIRGMSSRLLDRELYGQLLAGDGPGVVIDALLASDYASDVTHAFATTKGVLAAESALRRNLFRTFEKVISLAPPEPARLVNIQLCRWEVANIRAIVRGKARGATPDDIISATFPAGRFGEPQLLALADQPDLVALADTLVVWDYPFAAPLRAAVGEKASPAELPAADEGMDRLYFEWSLSQLREDGPNQLLLRELLQRQIDLVNLLAALGTVRDRERGAANGGHRPIPGGSLRSQVLSKVAKSARFEGAFEVIEDTCFAPAIERGILAFGEERKLAVVERFFESVVIGIGCRAFRRDPLGIGVVLGYIWRKYNEVVNLRILLRGKAYNVPGNRIREELCLI